MSALIIVGVDPGASGAIAALDPSTGDLAWVEDMPAHEGVVSAPLCADLLLGWDVSVAWVENVHSMPKQGVSSSFKFGRAFGCVVGVLGGARVPVEYVTPTAWKKQARVTSDKETCRRAAIELWPHRSEWFKRKKDADRAEAALIARYGWLLRRATPSKETP